MHFCTASIAIGGDTRNIMVRDAFAPVSWPEVFILREVHGGDAVTDVIPFVDVRQTARDERERLAMKYGDTVLTETWGGKNPPPELVAGGAKLKSGIIWMNPLSGQTEKTTAKGSEPYTIPPELRSVTEIVGNYAVRDNAAEEEEPEEAVPEENPTVVDDEDETPRKALAGKK